ncbi:MAG: hypothetical protein RSA90_06390 [Lachnospiraceae bacterium]
MQQNNFDNNQEIISMEEYLSKRQRIREKEQQRNCKRGITKETSAAVMLAELYV